MHHVDGEMHLIGMRLQAGGNGIHARHQFRQRVDEILRRPFDRRMFDQKIDYLHSHQLSVEVLLAFGLEKLGEQRRAVHSALGDRSQKLRRRLRDPAIPEKCFAQPRVAVRAFDRLITFGAKLADDFFDKRRVVCWPDRH